jgi:hypothetical protein
LDGGEGNEGGQGFGKVLEILGETPVSAEPGEGALDHPAARQDDEAVQNPITGSAGIATRRAKTMASHSRIIGTVVALIILSAGPALAREPLSDAQVRDAIIQESIARYQATGHPCACPYNLARDGKQCGRRSAYSRPGGAQPFCFPQDVSDGMLASWRRAHP